MKRIKDLCGWLTKDLVMKKPEITKNMSTPRYPFGKRVSSKWLIITETPATALKPSISGLYILQIQF
jgi:hypothetical protein